MAEIIVSVGTSLLENILDPSFRTNDNFKSNINRFLNQSQDIEKEKELIRSFFKNTDIPAIAKNASLLCSNICKYIEKFSTTDAILKQISKRCPASSSPDLLPAEISSLFLYYFDRDGNTRKNDHQEKDKVTLLCAETRASVFCAFMIKEIIDRNQDFKNVCIISASCTQDPYKKSNAIVVIEKLDMDKQPEEWIIANDGINEDCGFSNLREFISHKDQNNDTLYLNRTGGFKELCADLKIVAAEFGLPSFYLFKKSFTIIKNEPKRGGIDGLSNDIFQSTYSMS